ncbi:hypothetical protein [Streptomyces sp. NRRL F-5650]|uniref:hypothetical protein n=1 Tax=Streptomyces sp. NRRL F-5650 TaxID=1463868 RepID=UPI00131DF623|nr:hypothetical protein [Streptomyces sp. NRRL F-5650]
MSDDYHGGRDRSPSGGGEEEAVWHRLPGVRGGTEPAVVGTGGDAPGGGGLTTLGTAPPYCGAETSLNDLVYDWPCGFARFEIDVLYPERGWLDGRELARVAEALGHPVRQILARF